MRRCSSLIWNDQTSLLAPCLATLATPTQRFAHYEHALGPRRRGAPAYVWKHQRTQHRAGLQAASLRIARRRCEPQHAGAPGRGLRWPRQDWEPRLEVLLLLWDEMDDWLSAARHLLRNLT